MLCRVQVLWLEVENDLNSLFIEPMCCFFAQNIQSISVKI